MAARQNRNYNPVLVRHLIAAEVGAALTRETALGKNAASDTAQIVEAVAATLIALPADQLKSVSRRHPKYFEKRYSVYLAYFVKFM